MGRNKQQKPETFTPDPNTQACATCWYGEENEHGSIRCPLEVEPMGRADRCGEWTATEPETRVLVNGVDVTDNASPSGMDLAKATPVIAEVVSNVLSSPANEDDTSLSGQSLTEETPALEATTSFNLYDLRGFKEVQDDAIGRIYDYMRNNKEGQTGPGFSLSVKFLDEGIVRVKFRVSLPNDIKLDLPDSGYVRENGTITLEKARQATIFD